MKIKYMKMPVSIEEKRELNKQGFKVVDAKFDPNPVKAEEKPKRKARAKKA